MNVLSKAHMNIWKEMRKYQLSLKRKCDVCADKTLESMRIAYYILSVCSTINGQTRIGWCLTNG